MGHNGCGAGPSGLFRSRSSSFLSESFQLLPQGPFVRPSANSSNLQSLLHDFLRCIRGIHRGGLFAIFYPTSAGLTSRQGRAPLCRYSVPCPPCAAASLDLLLICQYLLLLHALILCHVALFARAETLFKFPVILDNKRQSYTRRCLS